MGNKNQLCCQPIELDGTLQNDKNDRLPSEIGVTQIELNMSQNVNYHSRSTIKKSKQNKNKIKNYKKNTKANDTDDIIQSE